MPRGLLLSVAFLRGEDARVFRAVWDRQPADPAVLMAGGNDAREVVNPKTGLLKERGEVGFRHGKHLQPSNINPGSPEYFRSICLR